MNAIAPIDALIDAELPAARGGDRAAYGRIVAACQNTVTAVALAITHDVSASEDIAQALSDYIQLFDRLLKGYLAGSLSARDVESQYVEDLASRKILI